MSGWWMIAEEQGAKGWWERPIGIVALGIVVTVVGGLAVWLISRHYDKPTTTTAIEETGAPHLQASQGTQSSTPAGTPSSQAFPGQKDKSPRSTRRTTGKVPGNSAVAGNNVPASNVLGNHNQVNTAPSIQINAPNGIAIGGGTVLNPTVNNFSPPPRHVPPEMRPELLALLRPLQGTVDINSVPDYESEMFADELNRLFADAGWKIKNPIVPIIIGIASKNVEMSFRGDAVKAPEQIVLSPGPAAEAAICINELHVQVIAHTFPNIPEGEVRITIGSNVP